MKKNSRFSLGKSAYKIGGHGIGINIHGCQPNPRNDHLYTKISSNQCIDKI